MPTGKPRKICEELLHLYCDHFYTKFNAIIAGKRNAHNLLVPVNTEMVAYFLGRLIKTVVL